VSDDRINRRNGYRHRDFDTRAGTLDVAIPKLRQGTYFPEWLLERRRRAERALTTVVATCYLLLMALFVAFMRCSLGEVRLLSTTNGNTRGRNRTLKN